MDRNELRSVAGMLLYGGPASVERIVHELVARNDRRIWDVLVETVRSDEEVPIRIRCLEVLARSASLGGHETAEVILAALDEADPVEGDGEGAK